MTNAHHAPRFRHPDEMALDAQRVEHDAYQRVISAREREHLLLDV
jgi:hypothetical protein